MGQRNKTPMPRRRTPDLMNTLSPGSKCRLRSGGMHQLQDPIAMENEERGTKNFLIPHSSFLVPHSHCNCYVCCTIARGRLDRVPVLRYQHKKNANAIRVPGFIAP